VIKEGKFVCFDGISCFKISSFLECSVSFGFSLFFSFLLPHVNLSPITTKKVRPFDSCIVCNILVMEKRLKSKYMVEHIHD
jgi:hypothetical protein